MNPEETYKLVREFAQCVDHASEVASYLNGQLDDPDDNDRHGLTRDQVRVVRRAIDEVLDMRETLRQRDLRCLANDLSDDLT